MALKVGIQLYSVRDEMAKDPIATMKAVAEIGYRCLEVANPRADQDPGVGFGVSAEDLLAALDGTGAHIISGHIRPVTDETVDAIIEYHKKIGNKYIGQSADFYDSVEHLLERCKYYNAMGKRLAEEGMKFVIHNHYHEFQKIDGKYVLDYILENTDPEYVAFEIDTFWVMRGGADPIEIIKKVGNRLMAVHQKDFSKTSTSPINVLANDDGSKFISRETFGGVINPLDFCEVGTGIMDIQSIIDAANEVGAEYIILEQDHTQLGQVESIKLSMENFKKYTGIEWE